MILPAVSAANWNVRHYGELSPQYRLLNQEGFTSDDSIIDVFGMVSPHVEWSSGQWFAEAKPEIRFVVSKGVKSSPTNPKAVSAATSRRTLNTRRTLFQESASGEAFFDLDRLNLRYTLEQGEVFAGRRPLSLGVLRFFPVWNKLTLPLIFQPGPEWIENPDVVGASTQRGRFSYRAFAARGNEPKTDDLALFENRFFGEGYEIQVLGGHWWEHNAVGATAAVDAMQSTLRFESLWISRFRDEPAQWQLGAGVERALSEKWTVVAEALYQSAGVDNFQNVVAPPNRFMVLSGKFYTLPYLTYQVHSLWLVQAGFLTDSEFKGGVALGGFEHSVDDNTSFTLKLKIPVGSSEGEFGSHRISMPFADQHQGMASTVLLQLQSTL